MKLDCFNTASGRCCWTIMLPLRAALKSDRFNTASGRHCCNTLKNSWRGWWRIISFNTASGRYCYFITFVFPSFQSGTRDVRTSSSLRSSSASHPSSHTASGRYCCNKRMTVKNSCSRITCFNTASGKYYYFITFVFPSLRSGTRDVRASSSLRSSAASHPSSHTASGRHCCNGMEFVTHPCTPQLFQYRKR